jgi:hypothetical protein
MMDKRHNIGESKSLHVAAGSTQRNRIGRTLLHSGFCYYCYERVHSPYLFCDDVCCGDYEKEMLVTHAGR